MSMPEQPTKEEAIELQKQYQEIRPNRHFRRAHKKCTACKGQAVQRLRTEKTVGIFKTKKTVWQLIPCPNLIKK